MTAALATAPAARWPDSRRRRARGRRPECSTRGSRARRPCRASSAPACSRATGSSRRAGCSRNARRARRSSSGRNTRKPVAAARPMPSAMPANVVHERSMIPTSAVRHPRPRILRPTPRLLTGAVDARPTPSSRSERTPRPGTPCARARCRVGSRGGCRTARPTTLQTAIAEAEQPEQFAGQPEQDERRGVGRRIDDLGRGRRVQEVEAEDADEQEHEEAAGARAEEAVVETDRRRRARGEPARRASRAARGWCVAPEVPVQQRVDEHDTSSSSGTSARNRAGDTRVAIHAPTSAAQNAPACGRQHAVASRART